MNKGGLSRTAGWRGARALLASLVLLCAAGSLSAQAARIPAFSGYVVDQAGMLSPAARRTLTERLQQLDSSDSTQIAILTMPDAEGQTIEMYAVEVFEKWQLGQEGKDNGILIVVLRDARELRIEVGYGLEGVITDLLAGRIVDNIMVPALRDGDTDRAFIEAVDALVLAARGEYTADDIPARGQESSEGGQWFMGLLFLFFMVVAGLGRISRVLGMLSGGILMGLAGLILGSGAGLVGAVVIGGFMFVIGLVIGLFLSSRTGMFVAAAVGHSMLRGAARGSGGGFGGGFSGGGGGSSGGGGASGRW